MGDRPADVVHRHAQVDGILGNGETGGTCVRRTAEGDAGSAVLKLGQPFDERLVPRHEGARMDQDDPLAAFE